MVSLLPFMRKLTLLSDTVVEQYWFYADGNVSATLGEKGGAVCAPILKYRVLSENSIELFGVDGNSSTVWLRIFVNEASLTMERNGRQNTFTIGPSSP